MAPLGPPLTILIPSFNDWESLRLLLPELDRAAENLGGPVTVLVVDDASTEPMPENWPGPGFTAITSVEILRLRSNQGHQRAIALGLRHIHEYTTAEAVVVMDGDGEDRPEDLPELLRVFAAGDAAAVVFAARTKRMESLAFQLCYQIYRLIHRALTGVAVRAGNFSVVPRSGLARLIAIPDLWNHYAAAVYRSGLPRKMVPLPRGRRLAGESQMNYASLVMHGLSAMSIFSGQIAKRLGAATVAAAIVIAIAGVTPHAGLVLWLGIPWLAFAALVALRIARRRDAPGFIPEKTVVYSAAGARKASAAGNSH